MRTGKREREREREEKRTDERPRTERRKSFRLVLSWASQLHQDKRKKQMNCVRRESTETEKEEEKRGSERRKRKSRMFFSLFFRYSIEWKKISSMQPSTGHTCDGGNRTLRWSQLCDGTIDCHDRFDEEGHFCSKFTFSSQIFSTSFS